MATGVRDKPSVRLDICNCCGSSEKVKVCARCKSVAYCSREHQKSDWSAHKEKCKEISASAMGKNSNSEDRGKVSVMTNQVRHIALQDLGDFTQSVTSANVHVSGQGNTGYSTEQLSTMGLREGIGKDDAGAIRSRSSQSIPHYQNNSGRNSSSAQHPESDTGLDQTTNSGDRGSSESFILETESFELRAPDYRSLQNNSTPQLSNSKETNEMPAEMRSKPYFSVVESRNKAMSDYVIKCLNRYGVCVIDNFLGESKGTDILDEVVELYESGCLTSGQLVNMDSNKGKVRGDVITWIDGSEEGCANITFLISAIDAIMLHCQKALGHYCIKGRSKAMVAAYPGNATGFLRHVDNPSGDGRCVTCIYYLNKNWNPKEDGGLLRIYPESEDKVANVEPKFDRLLFFWSDRRNPHEVTPSYRTRFAVTVWYYDQEERRRAVKRFKGAKKPEVSKELSVQNTKVSH